MMTRPTTTAPAGGTVPPTVDAALDRIFEQTGTVVPLSDFLYADSYERLMGGVQRGEYLGIHEAAGVPCHHLAFEQATIDWQLWIAQGDRPYPCRYVVSSKLITGAPRYSISIANWKAGEEVKGADFAFANPTNAKLVNLNELTDVDELPGAFAVGDAK